MRHIQLVAAAVLTLGSSLVAHAGPPRPRAGTEAAQALATLRRLVTPENPGSMGFSSPEEARQSTMDDPISVFMVRLDQLRAYRPGQEPSKLLIDLETAIYVVRVKSEARSSVEMSRVRGGWEARSFGNAPEAKLLDQVRREVVKATEIDSSAFFEVRIPALNLYFLGHQGPDGLMLSPLLDDPSLGFKAGEPQLAAKVLEKLQPLAQEHNGLPR